MTSALEAEAGDTRAGARIDLHCHTRASFDGVADPAASLQGDLVFTADAPRFIVIAEPAPRGSHPSSPASLP